MKKAICVLLAAILVLNLAACGASSSQSAASEDAETSAETSAEESVQAETTSESESAEASAEPEASEEATSAEPEESEETEAETEATDETEESAESGEESEEAAEEAEETLASLSYPLTDETVEITMWSTTPNLGPLTAWGGDYGVNVMEDYSSIQKAAEITGVSIVFENVNTTDASTQFSLHVASGEWDDILPYVDTYYAGGVSQAYEDGVILDLTDYLETAAPDYVNTMNSSELLEKASKTDDGSVLQLCTVYDTSIQAEGTVIRTDWLEQVGMEIPTTVDELHDVLTAFKTELGCTNPFYFNSACTQLMTSFDLDYVQALDEGDLGLIQIDGTVYSSFATESYRTWLETMREWYAEGLIDPDFISVEAVNQGGHDEDLLAADDLGVWWGNANSISNYYALCPAEDFSVTGIFISADGEGIDRVIGESLPFSSSSGVAGASLSATCSDPELALGWLNFWYTQEGADLMNYGVEGESYEVVDGEVQYTDVIMNSEYDIPPSVALLLYSFSGLSFGIQYQGRTFAFYENDEMTAINNWTDACDGSYAYPATNLNSDESAVISQHATDLCTCIAESVPRFIMGEYNLEEDWDAYLEKLDQMGLQECVAAYQSALDRYNAKG